MVLCEGPPERVATHPSSHTGRFLAPLLEGRAAQQPPAPKKTRKRAPAKKAAS
jgi:excinuclease ABC subunit A